jgi:GTP-binding protein
MPLKLAIVGRPNVGKSTLFNRLAGRKLAIVDDQPGVTRDRKFAGGRLGDLDLNLIDTAGFEDVNDESLEARMRRQTEAAIAECDVALFLIDAREGITPSDHVFGELLRRSGKPVILAANKAEGRKGEQGVNEAYELGLGEPIPISAEHGEGMADLYAAVLAHAEPVVAEPEAEPAPVEVAEVDAEDDDDGEAFDLDADFIDPDDDEDDAKPIRLAIVGRPNAGKSTLVNKLIGDLDRLLTGPEAGITRDSVAVEWSWEGRPVRLVDTAGLRRKAKVQEKLEKLSTQDTIRSLTFAEIVLLVMDATHPFETQDLQIADLVEREGRGLVFVLAKWDLVENPQATLKEFIEHAERMLPQVRGAPVVALSAETGQGLGRLMPAVLKLHRDWATKVKTRDLNDWLGMAVQRHPPPAVGGRRIKPKYIAQIKARPPTFVLNCSRADQMPEQYRRYLVNSLRESFDLPGVPIRITVKSGANPYEKQVVRPADRLKPRQQMDADREIKASRAARKANPPKPGAKKAVHKPKPIRPSTRPLRGPGSRRPPPKR